MTTPPEDALQRALEKGAQRSREVTERPVAEPAHVVLWRRHKWKILSLLFLLLTELCVLLLGSTLARGNG